VFRFDGAAQYVDMPGSENLELQQIIVVVARDPKATPPRSTLVSQIIGWEPLF